MPQWPGADSLVAAELGLLHVWVKNILRSSKFVPQAATRFGILFPRCPDVRKGQFWVNFRNTGAPEEV